MYKVLYVDCVGVVVCLFIFGARSRYLVLLIDVDAVYRLFCCFRCFRMIVSGVIVVLLLLVVFLLYLVGLRCF
jgi:hypothetical protein